MLQRLPIEFVQVKGSDTSEDLLNKIHHILLVLRKRNYYKRI